MKFKLLTPDELNLNKTDRNYITKKIYKFLDKLNTIFRKEYGHDLLPSIDSSIFSGSTTHLFDETIPLEDLLKYKPIFGDLDLKYPNEYSQELLDILNKNTGKDLGGDITIMEVYTNPGLKEQSHALVKIDDLYLQFDFENLKDFENRATNMNFSSNWEDVKAGFKGKYHKYLLGCIDRAYPLPGGGHEFSWSLNYGLRSKLDKTKMYKTPSEIFKALFKHTPKAGEEEKIRTVLGLVELINKYFNKEQKQRIVQAFSEYPEAEKQTKILKSLLNI
jgi:hypothetical protein